MIQDPFDTYTDPFDYEDEESEDLRIYEQDMKMQFMEDALAELHQMTESEACAYYHTDTKEEARKGIIEYWTYIA